MAGDDGPAPVELASRAANAPSAEFEPVVRPGDSAAAGAAAADADAPFDKRDPFKGGNPLADLPLRQLLRQWPTLLWQYWVASALHYRENTSSLRTELLSGVTIACMQVPESVAFSFVAGVDPLSGLFSTVFLGFITGAIGGKPGMVSGAAGAMAVVAKDIMSDTGPLEELSRATRFQHLMVTMSICGALQVVFGLLNLAKLVRLIPQAAMIGFVNALAIIIFLSQITAFQVCPLHDRFQDCAESEREFLKLSEDTTWLLLLVVFMTMAVMHLYPRIPVIGKMLPASLAALVVATAWEHAINRAALDIPTRTVEETAPVDGSFPPLEVGDVSGSSHWDVIMQYSASLAAIGLVESIMTLNACDELTGTPQSIFRANQESVAQGVGNFVCSIFGAMGGDAMIGQSTINVMNGARGRLSSMSAGIFLLIFILVASPVIDLIPIGGLTGVLFMVVLHTFHWATFKKLLRIRRSDAFVIVLVTVLAVLFDLAIAVVSGVIVTALVNSWDMGHVLKATQRTFVDEQGRETRVYRVYGSLFFGSVTNFKDLFDVQRDPSEVIVDFDHSLVCDYSAVAAIKSMYKRYREEGKHFHVKRLCTASREQFKRETKLARTFNLHTEASASRAMSPPATPQFRAHREKFEHPDAAGAMPEAAAGAGGAGDDAGGRSMMGVGSTPDRSAAASPEPILGADGVRRRASAGAGAGDGAAAGDSAHQARLASVDDLTMFQVPETGRDADLERDLERMEHLDEEEEDGNGSDADAPVQHHV